MDAMHIRLMTPVGISVVLIDAGAERAEALERLLAEQGYTVRGRAADFGSVVDDVVAGRLRADVLVAAAERMDPDFLDGLAAAAQALRLPIAVFSEDGASESIHAAVAAGANAYVVIGVSGNRLRSAIDLAKANFSSTLGLREELDEARTALKDRKVIERAKGIVMKQKGLDEEQAYALLRSRAMEKGLRLVDLALMITEAAEAMK